MVIFRGDEIKLLDKIFGHLNTLAGSSYKYGVVYCPK